MSKKKKEKLKKEIVDFLARMALAEDLGPGDITTRSIVGKSKTASARVLAKEAGVIAGLPVAKEVFLQLGKRVKFQPKIKDGARVKKGEIVAIISGPARTILAGERTALNFLQHLSGIATQTAKFKEKIKGTSAVLLDTRKTTPGLRYLEKYAVKTGGGTNHRFGLFDAILIKDNHIKMAGGIREAIELAHSHFLQRELEVEAKTLAEVEAAIQAGADRVLLDNMTIGQLKQATELCREAGVRTEASGGINLNNINAVAKTGVDYISVGALTHSAPALDISLKIE